MYNSKQSVVACVTSQYECDRIIETAELLAQELDCEPASVPANDISARIISLVKKFITSTYRTENRKNCIFLYNCSQFLEVVTTFYAAAFFCDKAIL